MWHIIFRTGVEENTKSMYEFRSQFFSPFPNALAQSETGAGLGSRCRWWLKADQVEPYMSSFRSMSKYTSTLSTFFAWHTGLIPSTSSWVWYTQPYYMKILEDLKSDIQLYINPITSPIFILENITCANKFQIKHGSKGFQVGGSIFLHYCGFPRLGF